MMKFKINFLVFAMLLMTACGHITENKSSLKGINSKSNLPPSLLDLEKEMVKIERGRFQMGSPKSEEGRDEDEIEHLTLIKGFYIQKRELTQQVWFDVMGYNPSYFSTALHCDAYTEKTGIHSSSRGSNKWGLCPNHPVERVSRNNIKEFIGKLNRLTGKKYRLPTEAEWEYTARAGSNTAYTFGNDPSLLQEYAWYSDNSKQQTHPVKSSKKPNKWGLYGMHGNVWEWVRDWYGDYPSSTVIDPRGPASGRPIGPNSDQYRVIRGGSWKSDAKKCRTANRDGSKGDNHDGMNDIGFRLAL